MSVAYSFLDTQCSFVGVGGAINLSNGGIAEEGITITPTGDIDTMTIGADGTPMHSLSADKSGTVTVRLLKTSPINSKLSAMYALQTADSSKHGQNTITLATTYTQDSITCSSVAFKIAPDLTWAKEGGTVEWVFNAGVIDRTLGNGGAFGAAGNLLGGVLNDINQVANIAGTIGAIF